MTRKERTAIDALLYYMYYMSELSEYYRYAFLHTGTATNIFDFTQASQKKKALHIFFYVEHIAQTHN